MPKRPAEHRLEEESHDAFRRALGDRFLYRREIPDYSVDGEVEEFDARDQATGLRFYVQLKSTRQDFSKRGASVSLPLERAGYYRALPLPLLMVLYSAEEGALYTRWFHQFDPYYGGMGKKTITFRWQPEDRMTRETPERLGLEARAFLDLRSSRLPLPLTLHLDVPEQGILGLTGTEITYAVREAVKRREDVLAFTKEPAKRGDVRIVLREDLLRGNLAEVSTASAHLSDGYDPGEYGDLIATDAMVMLALAFEHIGHADLAARLASTFLAESYVVTTPEVAWALSSSLARTRRFHESLAIAEALDESGDDERRLAGMLFATPLLEHGGKADAGEFDAFVRTFRRRIERRREAGERVDAGIQHYNLGSFYRRHARPEDALEQYELAAAANPEYLERPYFWRERAGVLFGAHYYQEAAEAYERAYRLKEDAWLLSLGADATMFAGRYREARDRFVEFNRRHPDPVAEEWRLKEVFLNFLVERHGIAEQARDREGAAAAMQALVGETTPALAASAVHQVLLRHDALNGSAWLNLGEALLAMGEGDAALPPLLAAALCLEGEAGAWVTLVVHAIELEADTAMVGDMITCAARMGGPGFRQGLVRWSRQMPLAARNSVLERVEAEMARYEERPKGNISLRFSDDDGAVEEMAIDPAEFSERRW
jgi:tetratricopeptide (TPR) repeat protein